jgi:hypothetical protein
VRTTLMASSPLKPALRSVASARSMGSSSVADVAGRLTTTIVHLG